MQFKKNCWVNPQGFQVHRLGKVTREERVFFAIKILLWRGLYSCDSAFLLDLATGMRIDQKHHYLWRFYPCGAPRQRFHKLIWNKFEQLQLASHVEHRGVFYKLHLHTPNEAHHQSSLDISSCIVLPPAYMDPPRLARHKFLR